MAGDEELERRVSALEGEVRDLNDRMQRSEHDAAAARVLAGGADRDVSEIRAEIREFRDQNNRVLNAMRDDLGTVRSNLDALTESVEAGFAQVDANFAGVRGMLDATAAGQARIVELLTRIVDRDG